MYLSIPKTQISQQHIFRTQRGRFIYIYNEANPRMHLFFEHMMYSKQKCGYREMQKSCGLFRCEYDDMICFWQIDTETTDKHDLLPSSTIRRESGGHRSILARSSRPLTRLLVQPLGIGYVIIGSPLRVTTALSALQ